MIQLHRDRIQQAESKYYDTCNALYNIRLENYTYTVTLSRVEKKRLIKGLKFTKYKSKTVSKKRIVPLLVNASPR